MRVWSLTGVTAVLLTVGSAPAEEKKEDKKPAGPVLLKVVLKKDKYVFGGGGRTPKEYKAYLEDLAKKQKEAEQNPNRELVAPPNPLRVDLVLQFENTSKEAVTVYMGGDANAYTFELTGGAGVVGLKNPAPMTLELRLPKAVTIEPGKVHEIPVAMLADGNRGISRFLFWTGPGEYQLVAKYTLSNQAGSETTELKSAPIKIMVAEK
jgi:hypothetical protein